MSVDNLLVAARDRLLALAPRMIGRCPTWALLVTPDLDGGAVVALWPIRRIARMLGLTGEHARAVVTRERAARGPGEVRVIVCAPGEPVQVVVMELGVRVPEQPARRTLAIPPAGAFCDHASMVECCDGCGHFSCPCGVDWDEGSEGGFFETYEGEFDEPEQAV